MSDSLAIRGGRVLDPGRGLDTVADVLIENGRIAKVGADLAAAQVIDASGLVVCPGFVDIHCHLRDPGFEHKETIETGTRAAARGGFTTVCCMPNTEPPIDSRATVEYVLRTAAAVGLVRVLPIGCVSRGRHGEALAELADLGEAGVVGFSDDGNPVADGALMRRALEYSKALGLPIIDHCEEPSLTKEGVMHEGWVATRLGLRGQPAAAEEAAVERDIALAEFTGSRVHIAHVSTRGSVDLVRAAKARGMNVTAEVTPHHLTLTHEAVAFSPAFPAGKSAGRTAGNGGLTPAGGESGLGGYDTNAKVNPPLRTREDVEACVEGLLDGTIDAIATDHAPHALEDKLCEFDQAAFGISNFETALGALLTLVPGGRLDLTAVVAKLTAGPVAALALDRRPGLDGLGSLAPGAPADVVVLDPQREWVVEPERFASKGRNTPLAGRSLRGQVIATVYGGRVVYALQTTGIKTV
jgi:dihydroorotase